MEVHGSSTETGRKEIRCVDCGHRYVIAEGQYSSICSRCANVAYHRGTGSGLLNQKSPPPAAPVLPLSRERVKAPGIDHLAAFRRPVDGKATEALLIRYQVEWQLWSALVQNFGDPVHHSAYLSLVTETRAFDVASNRYRQHASVMALVRENSWQSSVAELMLSRLEQLALVRLRLEQPASGFLWQRWAQANVLAFRSRAVKYFWVGLGAIVAIRLILLGMK